MTLYPIKISLRNNLYINYLFVINFFDQIKLTINYINLNIFLFYNVSRETFYIISFTPFSINLLFFGVYLILIFINFIYSYYFPIQNFSNIFSKISSLIFCPVISPNNS